MKHFVKQLMGIDKKEALQLVLHGADDRDALPELRLQEVHVLESFFFCATATALLFTLTASPSLSLPLPPRPRALCCARESRQVEVSVSAALAPVWTLLRDRAKRG